MSKICKSTPDGIDVQIQRLQTYLYDKLTLEGWTDHDSYERAYKVKRGDKIIPMIYSGKEYYDLLINDKADATSFFLVSDTEDINDSLCKTTVSWIMQANLQNIYPTIAHRADEELRSDLKRLLKLNPYGFHLKKVTTGVDSVYDGLDINLKFSDDMNQFHVVRFDLELNYVINNC